MDDCSGHDPTTIKFRYIHEYRDRTGKLRRYVRRPGFPRVSLPGLPGSHEFMEAYQAATAGTAPQSNTRNGPGSLGAVAIAFYRSTEFANLKPTSQRISRIVLGPILENHSHGLVRELPRDRARKIIEDIGVKRPGMANLTRAVMRRVLSFSIELGLRGGNPFDRNTPGGHQPRHHPHCPGQAWGGFAHPDPSRVGKGDRGRAAQRPAAHRGSERPPDQPYGRRHCWPAGCLRAPRAPQGGAAAVNRTWELFEADRCRVWPRIPVGDRAIYEGPIKRDWRVLRSASCQIRVSQSRK
jgi:hypothetical protein